MDVEMIDHLRADLGAPSTVHVTIPWDNWPIPVEPATMATVCIYISFDQHLQFSSSSDK